MDDLFRLTEKSMGLNVEKPKYMIIQIHSSGFNMLILMFEKIMRNRRTIATILLTSFNFSGFVYFDIGIKHPKIILDGYVFTCHRNKLSKTTWVCASYKKKCRARLITSGKVVIMVGEGHNHEPKYKSKVENLTPQAVTIVNKFKV
ncbi:hypothetical protein WA026_007543 [Henosepilachna vigintioctopunctata]|uniref:FLYWCH-type domain-containing protein n=1 Tax=Henosepilachna vigintioctopunctata TaxID=420089 RepID=A0AAW1UMF9_9CUCU